MVYNSLGCDKVRFIVLASGSGGNSTYLEIGNKKVLIDAGLSFRQVVSRLNAVGKDLTGIDYVFLTHEHGDHIAGLVTIQKRTHCQIFLSEGTFQNLPLRIKQNLDPSLIQLIDYQTPILLDDFAISVFMTFHDALEPCGYRFTEKGKSLVYMTDTGYFPQAGFDLIRNAEAYVIESNHDPELLLDSARPWLLKKRILDDQGHLSNEDSAFLVTNILGEKTRHVVLAHLSEECNTTEDALKTYQNVFEKQGLIFTDYQVVCAKQDYPIEEIDV